MYFTFYYCTQWKQITSELTGTITSFYTSREKYILYLYYTGSKNWEPETCGASASSMLREGNWSHVEYMTNTFFFNRQRLFVTDALIMSFLCDCGSYTIALKNY